MHVITKLSDSSKIVTLLSRYKVVSFDIFDTLISRLVSDPHDVFALVEREFNHLHPHERLDGFRDERVSAERRVREVRDFKEVTFEIIYAELSKTYGAEVSERLAELELNLEHQLSVPNRIGGDIFNAAKDAGLTIILTSDMYLSGRFIRKLLCKNDIAGYDELFVSSEHNRMKSDGTLYEMIHEEMGIEAHEMIHLGDNLKSDFLRPIRMGGRSCWLPKSIRKNPPDDGTLLRRFLDSKQANLPIEEDVGYNKLGPLLFGFSQWLCRKVEEHDVDHLLFLARDGKLMRDAFRIVGQEDTKHDYLYVSRQVLILPTIWMEPELKQIESFASISEKSTVGSVLERLGVRDMIDQSLLDQFSLGLGDTIDGTKLSESEVFSRFYECIQPKVVERSKECYEALVAYLRGFELSGKIAVVDIGWNGSMQRALSRILETAQIDVEIVGYYFGVNPESSYVAANPGAYHGYLFDHRSKLQNYIKEECFRNMFETLFLARHGSVREIHDGGEIELYEYEYEGIEDVINRLQRSSITFVKDYTQSVSPSMVEAEHEVYYEAIFRLGLTPTKTEAKFFGEMAFFDVDLEYLAKVEGNNVLDELRRSKWKTGYMVNLTGMRLPFHLLVQWKNGRQIRKKARWMQNAAYPKAVGLAEVVFERLPLVEFALC